MRGQQSGCSEDVKEMLLLLLSYFDEKEESMFFHVDDTCLAEEVELGQVPLTPTIIVCATTVSTSIIHLSCCFYTGVSSKVSKHFLGPGVQTAPRAKAKSQTQTKSRNHTWSWCGGVEEPLISHGWRRMQTHLRALFNLPSPCRLLDLRTFTGPAERHRDLDRAGRHQGHKGSPPGLQESQESDSAHSQIQQTTWRPRTSREDSM
ncbi:hypothetical protein D4764_12G0010500 [Takifugu flavidus]|uniref:Uncharacterized protein n=1 Tax=Takifugu flavidus TaxID=433684 RepID=A0A5C6PHC7_9TELE|nr:hypothetical protein D4764_12G0010500 [Takifugu flavidus]